MAEKSTLAVGAINTKAMGNLGMFEKLKQQKQIK